MLQSACYHCVFYVVVCDDLICFTFLSLQYYRVSNSELLHMVVKTCEKSVRK